MSSSGKYNTGVEKTVETIEKSLEDNIQLKRPKNFIDHNRIKNLDPKDFDSVYTKFMIGQMGKLKKKDRDYIKKMQEEKEKQEM